MARLFLLCVWMLYYRCVSGYNIETKKIGLVNGTKGTQFGYSVAFANEPGWVIDWQRGEKLNKVLLVGAPNTTENNIKGYGDVQQCSSPNTGNIPCSSLNIRQIYASGSFKGKSMCDQLRKSTNKSHCEEDQRLGATIAVNRNYESIMYTTSTVPMVTVCAPGWKNTFNEFSENHQKYMIGICLKLDKHLGVLDCMPSDDKEYCWPFWPTRDTAFYHGRPVYSYAESGFAVDFTKDGLKEVIAAPGIEDWRGGYKSHQGQFTKQVKRRDHPTTQYYGYSLVTGKFKVRNADVLAGVPNFYDRNNGNLGKAEILKKAEKEEIAIFGKVRKCSGIKVISPSKHIKVEQVGSKFGAAVAAIDITGDDYDEVFVGAPLYSGEQTEEGRVFVYTTTENDLCGPIGILSGSATINNFKSQANYARFGTSITSAGDLNDDSYKDVAIGAPYEDAGRGAVYIYHGIGMCNCRMKDSYAQRILGRDLDPGLRTFGWHIYGEDDVDHNEYPDLAVGAYASSQAVVLRTRPIASVSVEMQIQPSPIPLNGSSLACSVDKARLCIEVNVMFRMSGKGLADTLTLEFELKTDTVYKEKEGDSRLVIRGTDDSVLHENLTISKEPDNMLFKTYTLDVKNRSNTVEPNDIWTVVRIEGSFDLVKSSGSAFDVLDPVLEEGVDNHIQKDVAFEINCDNLADCTSDLRLTVELYLLSGGRIEKVTHDTVIFLDASNELHMKVDVTNLVSSSYGSNFTSSAGAALMKDVSLSDSRQGAIDATCKQLSEKSSSRLNCSADSKLDRNQNFKVKAGFDISRARLMSEDNMDNLQPFIEINVTAGQVNNDVDTTNNDFNIKLPVQLKYKIEVTVDKETSDQERYFADEQSTRRITVTHRYYITNEGPSTLPKTYVNITVPLAMKDIVYAEIKKVSTGCKIEGKGALVESTTTPKSTEAPTTRFTIQTPKPQRRRRELDTQESSGNQTEKPDADETTGQDINTVFIRCQDRRYECDKIICAVTNLQKNEQKTIDVTIDIIEKSLAKAKAKREIRYDTRVEVTDPYVWHGGKVVPWDKTPFGEKWTTFIVEPASVVTEISIWIIIGSILGAVILLIIVVVVLWKVGFFKRKKHSKVEKWKQESMYKRRSRVSSTKSQAPYNPMEK